LPEQKTLTLPPNLYLGLLPFQIFQNMTGPDGKPMLSRARMTTEQANALRAEAKMSRFGTLEPVQLTPTPVPWDDDDSEMTEDQKRHVRGFTKGGRPSTVRAPR
jgi:hypothetical protein